MILRQREAGQLVEVGKQAGQRARAADMGPLREPEVALGQQQMGRLGHYAIGRLHLGQLGGLMGQGRQAELLASQGHRQQTGARAAGLGQAQEEALRQVGDALDGGVATAETQLAGASLGAQHLVAAALAQEFSAFQRARVNVAGQAEVQLPGGGRQLAQAETEPDIITVTEVDLGMDQGCRHGYSSD
ncbi:hypothetical protein D3C85_890270 [compost metagenome]